MKYETLLDRSPEALDDLLAKYQLRVKRTPDSARHGVRCLPSDHRDNRLWPGEVGRIIRTFIRGSDWWQSVVMAEFSSCRRVHIAESEIIPGPYPKTFEQVPLTVSWRFESSEFILEKKPTLKEGVIA